MQLGVPMSERCRWPVHEDSDRYESLSPSWAKELIDAGIEAVHWSELRPANTPDPAIMAYAASNDFVILTNDLDFGIALATSNKEKPSVAQIRGEDLRPATIGKQVVIGLRQMQTELDEGALLTIDPKRTRLRLLPLRKME
jgi:predicted nuclease of predicted toxin-antitoxin system